MSISKSFSLCALFLLLLHKCVAAKNNFILEHHFDDNENKEKPIILKTDPISIQLNIGDKSTFKLFLS